MCVFRSWSLCLQLLTSLDFVPYNSQEEAATVLWLGGGGTELEPRHRLLDSNTHESSSCASKVTTFLAWVIHFTSCPENEQNQVLSDGLLMGAAGRKTLILLSTFYTVGVYQQEKTFEVQAGILDSDFNKAKKNSLEEFQINFK